jgi:hypothetical protein
MAVRSRPRHHRGGWNIWSGSTLLGWVGWSQDAGHGDYDRNGRLDPRDAILASDNAADGRAVQAKLSTGRIASTRGHNAPYNTGWKTGDLPEGHTY